MARKRVIFVIVEGPSDEEALGVLLSRIYGDKTVYVHIMRKDITSMSGVSPSNIVARIGNEIRDYAKSQHFTKADFNRIIHIIDMDGAFIPDSSVIEEKSATKALYLPTEIRTCNKEGIKARNRQKRAVINRLCNESTIWALPYCAYYMSCNLDHVLYNKPNSSDEEKEKNSYRFAQEYKGKVADFISFISRSDFSVVNGHKESWDFIKQDLHSLERHTNFGLCFYEQDGSAPLLESERR